MNGVIYMYTSPSGKQYIGQTINEKRRRGDHARAKANTFFHRAVNKYGIDAFEYKVLHCGITSLKILNILEVIEIKSRQTIAPKGYNMRDGGHHGPFSIEARKKMSESHSTPEHLALIRKIKLGVSNEKAYKAVICVETGEAFQSRKHAAAEKGCLPSHIKRSLDNPRASIGGFHWASSKESAEKMKPNLVFHVKPPQVKIQCYETGAIFNSLADAARYCGRGETDLMTRWAGKAIKAVIDNQERTAYGYHWVTPGNHLEKPRVGGGRKKWIRCVETGTVFPTVTDAANSCGVTVGAISQAAKKGRPSSGYHWEYC